MISSTKTPKTLTHAHLFKTPQYDHPDGVTPHMIPAASSQHDPGLKFFNDTVQSCPASSFHEMTGSLGDVILLHPLMLHSASKNGRRLARVITNPPVSLNEPFNFDRANPAEYSLVERKTIQDLGGQEKLRGWKITGERKAVVPERLRVQAKWMEEEAKRLRDAGREYMDRTQTEASIMEQAMGLKPTPEMTAAR